MKTKLIVNPAAGKGLVAKQWTYLQGLLHQEDFAFEYAFTERRGHATELARAALEAGYDLLVSVGGDGTLNEVANGLLAGGEAHSPDAVLGIIPAGTGADFARTVGLPRQMAEAAHRLARATETRQIDVAEATYISIENRVQARRCFVNVAGMGFDGAVVERYERSVRRGSGTFPYLLALCETIWSYRNNDLRLEVDGREVRGTMNSVIVCNGRYFGGGMYVSPQSNVDDGRLDVVTLGNLGRIEFLLNVRRVYNGSHLTHPKVRSFGARTIVVEPRQRMLLQADGELIGEGPASFRLLPAALRLRV